MKKSKKNFNKIACVSLAAILTISSIGLPNILANEGNNKTISKEARATIPDAPNFTISNNNNTDKVYSGYEIMTFDISMSSVMDVNYAKAGDKLVIQLPPNGIDKGVADMTDSLKNSVKTEFIKNSGTYTITFNEDVNFTGNSFFKINFVVSETKIDNYNMEVKYKRNSDENAISLTNNIFNSSGIPQYKYSFLSPYWQTDSGNWIGTENVTGENVGLFLSSENKASFYVDMNYDHSFYTKGWFYTMQLRNQVLNLDSIRLVEYNGAADTVGTDVTGAVKFTKEEEIENGKIKAYSFDIGGRTSPVQIEANPSKRYRLYYDVNVINNDVELISQYYSNSILGGGQATDNVSPIIKSIMTPKTAKGDYIPAIYATAEETLKVGSNFDALENVTASDFEDGDLTNKVKIVSNNVNTGSPGKYKVVYQVTDSNGNTTTLTKIVNVVTDNPPVINGVTDKTIFIGDIINLMDGVSATDAEDGTITNKVVTIGSVDTSKQGICQVIYQVTDSDGNTTQAISIITVIAPYKIEFDANTGTGTMGSQEGKTGEDVQLSNNLFVKDGYRFTGWNTEADGTGTAYVDGASYTMGASDVTLYAQWKAIDYTVTVNTDANGTASVDKDVANVGDVVNVTINANDGYELKAGTLKAITASGIEIPLTQIARIANGTFTFEMPAEDVTVFAEFELIPVVTPPVEPEVPEPPVVELEKPQPPIVETKPETGKNPTTGTSGLVGILGAMGLAGATTLLTRKRKNK